MYFRITFSPIAMDTREQRRVARGRLWSNRRIRQAKILWIIKQTAKVAEEHKNECECKDADLVQVNGEGPFIETCKEQEEYALKQADGYKLLDVDINTFDQTRNFVMKKVLKAYLNLEAEYDPYRLIDFFELESSD